MILDPFVLVDVSLEEDQRHTWEYSRANGIDAIKKATKQVWMRGIFRWFQAIWANGAGTGGSQATAVSCDALCGLSLDAKELSGKSIRRGEIPWRPARIGRG